MRLFPLAVALTRFELTRCNQNRMGSYPPSGALFVWLKISIYVIIKAVKIKFKNMLKNKINYFLFLLLFLLPLSATQAAGTDVSTNITSPDWTEANSPYVVNGTIEVTKGAVLKIEAGTEIKFAAGAKILVNGELDVLGTPDNPVVMTSLATTPKSGDWSGIEFTDKSVSAKVVDGGYVSGSIIKNAIIKFSTGISCDDASPYIINNQMSLNKVALDIKGNNYSTGGLVMDASAASVNDSLIPVYVKNNNFSDNDLGIKIERNNGQNFVATPAGYSYIGKRMTTAYISGNTINSNASGVEIANGDNNVLLDNTIKYNFTTGIKLASSSRSNLISRNTINNNNVGLDSSSANLSLLQNNLKNNFIIGAKISAKPTIIAQNNIANNQIYNLDNRVYGLVALNNYWGSADTSAIEQGILVTGDASSSTTTLATLYPVKYNPFLSAETSFTKPFAPVIMTDLSSTSTPFSKQDISGIKPAGTAVYINGNQVVAFNDQVEWTFTADLQLGANSLNISYLDRNNQSSDVQTVSLTRINLLDLPTINTSSASTSAEKITLSGNKPVNSGIWLNGQMVSAVNAVSTWKYEVALNKGINTFTIEAKDGIGGGSEPISFTIERIAVPATSVIADEKKLTTKVDTKLAAKLAGQFLLQTERSGLIWYVYPVNNKRYLITQDGALDIFRNLAVGIAEADLKLIPTKASGAKGNALLRNKFKGKLLLRVGASGQITYVDLNGYRHDISASNLMANFKALSLGITNVNLRKLTVGEIVKK